MTHLLLLSALVILACVLCNKLSSKLGVPTLLAFILLGMFFGSDGVVKIPFDNYGLAQNICSFALIFIMFYGGFGTNWSQAKPVAGKAAILSSFGTAFTAGLVGLFCWAVLSLPTLESFLLGAVIASTDAASVFSILRSKRLNLRDHTASLLEVESGSNDPFSYMLTLILLTLMTGEISAPAVVYQIFAQLVYGGALGAVSYTHLVDLKGHPVGVQPDLPGQYLGLALGLPKGHRLAGRCLGKLPSRPVVQVKNARLTLLEQQALGLAIGLHGPVKIQVVPGEVGENPRLEPQPRRPAQGQGVGGNLHHHMGAPRLLHPGQQALEGIGTVSYTHLTVGMS